MLPDETLTVLRPWLTATRRRRPYLTWAYTLGGVSREKLDEQLVADLRHRVDLVLADNVTQEGVPGGHAPEHFTLRDHVANGDLWGWLSTSYAGGIRSVLVAGGSHAGLLHDNFDCVDEIIIAVDRADPRRALAAVTKGVTASDLTLIDVSPKK